MSNAATETGGPKSLLPGQMRHSRVGKRPIPLPKGVTVNVSADKVEVKGPKGTLTRPMTPNVKVKTENNELHVYPTVMGRDGLQSIMFPPDTGATAENTSAASHPSQCDITPPFESPVA